MRILARNVSAMSVHAVEHGEWLHALVWPEEITGPQRIDTCHGKRLLTGQPARMVDSLTHEIAHFLTPQIHQQGAPTAEHRLGRITRPERLGDLDHHTAPHLAVRSDTPRRSN